MRKASWISILFLGLAAVWLVWIHEQPYLQAGPGLYFEPSYQGLFFSTLVYQKATYTRGVLLATLAGGLLLGPMVATIRGRYLALQRQRDFSGNHIDKAAFERALKRYRRLCRKKNWCIRPQHRNQIWLGVDLLTGRDVFMDGEDLFKGTVILGAQGTGKTSRYFKVMMKQLAEDARTAFVVFSLKDEDGRSFAAFLHGLGKRVIHWAACNVLDLCMGRSGGYQESRLQALLHAAAQATGLQSKDPFWLNGALSRLIQQVMTLRQHGQPATLGNAFVRFKHEVENLGPEARMEQGLLETLKPALELMSNPVNRGALLHSPNHDGGLHYGALMAAPNSRLRAWTDGAWKTVHVGDQPTFFEAGLYELSPGTRLPLDWEGLLDGTSVILPPPGQSKGELFALNMIKASLLGWITEDMSSPDSRLLQQDPADRFRIVLAQDEGHNFLMLDSLEGGSGFSDTKALAENRQAGQVSILATQSISRLFKGSREKVADFLSVNANYLLLGVNGEEREKVLKVVGRVEVTRIERAYGRQEEGDGKAYGAGGQLKAQGTRANVNETVRRSETHFIAPERYGQFPQGMAIYVAQGQPHRLLYCPIHAHVTVKPAKVGWLQRLLGRCA